jgi:hypothetical protein
LSVQRYALSVGRFLHPSLLRRNRPRIFARTLARFPAGEKPVPKSSDGRLFLIGPGEVTILAVKFLGNNFHGTKHSHKSWSQEFSGHLRVLDV